nr:unnamed protein product [Digitaria exilis]
MIGAMGSSLLLAAKQGPSPELRKQIHTWRPPPEGMVKLNCDGGFCEHDRFYWCRSSKLLGLFPWSRNAWDPIDVTPSLFAAEQGAASLGGPASATCLLIMGGFGHQGTSRAMRWGSVGGRSSDQVAASLNQQQQIPSACCAIADSALVKHTEIFPLSSRLSVCTVSDRRSLQREICLCQHGTGGLPNNRRLQRCRALSLVVWLMA